MNILGRFRAIKAKEKFSVGLDIGSRHIKMVKLQFSGADAKLCAFDMADSSLDPAEALKKMKQLHELESVNISFCGSATVIRYVNFPRMNTQELKQALRFEAQKHIPFSLQEVSLDAAILKDNLADNKMLVLLAAVKKEFMQQRLKPLEAAGLKVGLIDLDSLALMNAFNFNYPKVDLPDGHKAFGLLNIGSSLSSINIIDDEIPRFSRDIHIGGGNFTKKLMDIFGVDFESAQKLMRNPDAEKQGKIKASAESVLTNLAAEIRTSFDYYESQNTSSVTKIFLSGGSSRLDGLKDILANSLGIAVDYWDPFKKISLADKVDAQKLNLVSSQLNVAAGLALR